MWWSSLIAALAALCASAAIAEIPLGERRSGYEQMSPATQLAEDGQTVVRLVAKPDRQENESQRPGATVVARVQCGRASLGYVWLHDLWDAVRSWLVF